MIKPLWLKVRPPTGIKFQRLKKALNDSGLNTVCQSADCPNIGDCWTRGNATFMIMGSVCTRNCRFCAVKKGKEGEPLDPLEPEKIAIAVKETDLKHVVLTSVDRDDLKDGGAGHFAECIRALKQPGMDISIEALILIFMETEDMVLRTLRDLKNADVDIITIGQYLRPTIHHFEVKEYLPPEMFEFYKKKAQEMGFLSVVSGPLVRSSYNPLI